MHQNEFLNSIVLKVSLVTFPENFSIGVYETSECLAASEESSQTVRQWNGKLSVKQSESESMCMWIAPVNVCVCVYCAYLYMCVCVQDGV